MENKFVDPYRSGNIINDIAPELFYRMVKHGILGYKDYYNINLFWGN